MFSKEEIDKATEVIKEKTDYIRMTDPYGTTEIDILKFMIHSLGRYLDREEIVARYIEWQKQYELARCQQLGRRL